MMQLSTPKRNNADSDLYHENLSAVKQSSWGHHRALAMTTFKPPADLVEFTDQASNSPPEEHDPAQTPQTRPPSSSQPQDKTTYDVSNLHYLERVRNEIVIARAEGSQERTVGPTVGLDSPKKHNFVVGGVGSRQSSKRKSRVRVGSGVKATVKPLQFNSSPAEKYAVLSNDKHEATIIQKDTAKQSRNKLKQMMSSAGNSALSQSNKKSANSSPKRQNNNPKSPSEPHRHQHSQPMLLLNDSSNFIENQNRLNKKNVTNGKQFGKSFTRNSMSDLKVLKGGVDAEGNMRSKVILQTCENINDLLVGDIAQISGHDLKFIPISDQQNSQIINGRQLNFTDLNKQNRIIDSGLGEIQASNTDTHEAVDQDDSESQIIDRVAQIQQSPPQPAILKKTNFMNQIISKGMKKTSSDARLQNSGISRERGHNQSQQILSNQLAASQSVSLLFCQPVSTKVDFTHPLYGQYKMPYQITRDNSTQRLRVQKIDNDLKQKYYKQLGGLPQSSSMSFRHQSVAKKRQMKSQMGTQIPLEKKKAVEPASWVCAQPGSSLSTIHHQKSKSNLIQSGTGAIGRGTVMSEIQATQKPKHVYSNRQPQMKSSCSNYTNTAQKINNRQNSTSKYMAKIGKSSGVSSSATGKKSEINKRSNKLGSVDLQASFGTSNQILESYHQRKKSSYGATAGTQSTTGFQNQKNFQSNIQNDGTNFNTSKLYGQKTNKMQTHRLVQSIQQSQVQPAAPPFSSGPTQKKATAAQVVDRLYQDSDMRRKRKEELRKKLQGEKVTMVPKVTRRGEGLLRDKMETERIEAECADSYIRGNFFLGRGQQVQGSRQQVVSPMEQVDGGGRETKRHGLLNQSRNSNSLSPIRKEKTTQPEAMKYMNMTNTHLKSPLIMYRASVSNMNQTQGLGVTKSNYFKTERNSMANINNFCRNQSLREEATQIMKEISFEVDKIEKLQEQVKEQQKMYLIQPNSSTVILENSRNLQKVNQVLDNDTIQETNREATEMIAEKEIRQQVYQQNGPIEAQGTQDRSRMSTQNEGDKSDQIKPLTTQGSDMVIGQHVLTQPVILESSEYGLDFKRGEVVLQFTDNQKIELQDIDDTQTNNQKSKRDLSSHRQSREDFFNYLAQTRTSRVRKYEHLKNQQELQQCTFNPRIIQQKSPHRFGFFKRSTMDNNFSQDLSQSKDMDNQNMSKIINGTTSTGSQLYSSNHKYPCENKVRVYQKNSVRKSTDFGNTMRSYCKKLKEGTYKHSDMMEKGSHNRSIDGRSTQRVQINQVFTSRMLDNSLARKKQQLDSKYSSKSFSKKRNQLQINNQIGEKQFHHNLQTNHTTKHAFQSSRLSLRKRSQEATENRHNVSQACVPLYQIQEDDSNQVPGPQKNEMRPQHIVLQNQEFQIHTASVNFFDMRSDKTMTPMSQTPAETQKVGILKGLPESLLNNNNSPLISANGDKIGSKTQTMRNSREQLNSFTPLVTDLTDDTQTMVPVLVSIRDQGVILTTGDQQKEPVEVSTASEVGPPAQPSPPPLHHPAPLYPQPSETMSSKSITFIDPQNINGVSDEPSPDLHLKPQAESQVIMPSLPVSSIQAPSQNRRKSQHSPRRKRRDRKKSGVPGVV